MQRATVFRVVLIAPASGSHYLKVGVENIRFQSVRYI